MPRRDPKSHASKTNREMLHEWLTEHDPARLEGDGRDAVFTVKEVAEEVGIHYTNVARLSKALREDKESGKFWEPPEREYPTNLWELTTDDLPALLRDFLYFRRRHFRTPRGEPFSTEPFHQRWIEAFLHALVTGGRLVILSPPRHGKTELLVHFATWLIVRFPLIRILWIGGNETVAKRSVAQVQSQLHTNQSLIEETLGPNGSYKPERSDGLPWTKSEFTVTTRPFPIKGTSMTALGRGGTLLSLDADLIICDDIEDHKSTIQPGMRESTREWFTSQLESRKMHDTALCLIGSRQHPDDLAGHLVSNEAYHSIVETAHDPECPLPDDSDHYDEHVECMLFPDLNPYEWLMQQRQAADSGGGRAHFEMVYLNISHPKGMVIFTPEIVNKGIDHSRAIGHVPINTRLIAGLDPSGVGFQAAFLWAVSTDPFKLFMVDIDNNEGGGIKEARRIMEEWKREYGCSQWVVEQALWATGLDKDHDLKDWCAANGVHVEGHLTYTNKWDNRIGVSNLVTLFSNEEISLPYADGPSQDKTDAYRHQLIYFSSEASANRNSRTGYKSDLVMASWFPMDAIRRAVSEDVAEMGVDYSPSFSDFGANTWDTPPWDDRQDLEVLIHG